MSFQPKRIMVAFDFSEPSIGAVRYGQAIVGDGDTIQVVNIIDDNFPTYASIEYPEIIDKKQQVLRCRKMRDDLTDAGMDISNLKFQSEFGDPGTELARIASQLRSDLVVISSHGRRGVGRVLLGSVAERVARLAPCPVLILKPCPSSFHNK